MSSYSLPLPVSLAITRNSFRSVWTSSHYSAQPPAPNPHETSPMRSLVHPIGSCEGPACVAHPYPFLSVSVTRSSIESHYYITLGCAASGQVTLLHRVSLHRVASHRVALHQVGSLLLHRVASHQVTLHRDTLLHRDSLHRVTTLGRIALHQVILHQDTLLHRVSLQRVTSHQVASHWVALHRVMSLSLLGSRSIGLHHIRSHCIRSHCTGSGHSPV